MQITAQNRQSLADKTIEGCGAVESIFEVADRNDMAITDDPITGQAIEVSPACVAKRQIVARLKAYGAAPATGITQSDADTCPYGGIGYMGIEYDLTVAK